MARARGFSLYKKFPLHLFNIFVNTTMATTRVFVRGLPPSVSEDDFRDHFAKHYAVTDIKLLSQRRIGYVGFRTNEDAAAAVKYFNRSFLRMSKIGVELVDNVGQALF